MIFRAVLNGHLHRAPLPPTARQVLDMGTGTGNWAIDFADEHPDSEVLGVDLSLVQPSSVPVNCQFFVDDLCSHWVYEKKFDFIHGRTLMGSIQDWTALVGETYENLTDGGWVEFQEFEPAIQTDDDSFERAPTVRFWSEKFSEAAVK
jgi:trans-aconitate methyltransferase